MDVELQAILEKLDTDITKLEGIKETILATTMMISEIPAPTFREYKRAEFLADRFSELEMLNTAVDEKNNAIGIIPGLQGDKNILVTAHIDTIFSEKIDHTVTVDTKKLVGPGVSDNTLSIGVLGSLPVILDHLDVKFDSNLIVVGNARSLGSGDLEGIKFLLDNTKHTIHSAVCLEAVRLGRLSYSSIGMLRGDLCYSIPETYDWTKFESTGGIVVMNDIINRILEIPLPRKPRTSIVLGQLEAGTSYNTLPTKAVLRFEIRSESESIVSDLVTRIYNLADEMESKTGAHIEFKEISRRKPGGTDFSHPMNTVGRAILHQLNITTRATPSTSEVAALIERKIPSITIGLTRGDNAGEINESIDIEPISMGLTQLIALLKAIDAGCT